MFRKIKIHFSNLFLGVGIGFVLLLAFLNSSYSQTLQQNDPPKKDIESFRLMFYNVENFFDTYDDTLTIDEEYLPQGMRNWNYSRFLKKRNNIYKTIVAVGGMTPPALIGLCEIENRFVLKQLVYESPLAHYDYRIVQEESPDRRGIDVALLYNPKSFELIEYQTIEIAFPDSPETKTRDILYAKGIVFGTDTLHVFVNHWPSRYGGELSSEPRRFYVAGVLASHVDSLLAKNKNAQIVVMGDFNDYPYDVSIKEILNSGKDLSTNRLMNLMPLTDSRSFGSHKFQGEWGILDQIMVSVPLYESKGNMKVETEAHIFDADFLLQNDDKYLGKMPFRTFIGAKYEGGFSDHLPVFVDFHIK